MLIGISMTRTQVWLLVGRASVVAAVLTGSLLAATPEKLFDLPRRDLGLWALIMVIYPVLSVYPQGLLYRGLYYARYAVLFRDERAKWMAGAAVFSLAHLVFANVWAIALTFAGGLLINRTYRKTEGVMTANIEHAIYGQLVFTCGWGHFFYHGITRLAEGLQGS